MQWAVELLDVQPSDRILEIGCGAGHAIALICDQLKTGTITAIDRSATAVARASERNAACVAAGLARVEQQTLTNADLGRRFAKIFAINVNAFWTKPESSLLALSRLLQPKGLAHLVYEPPSPARLRELRTRLTTLLGETAFDIVDVREREFRAGHGLCVVVRPSRP